MSTTYTTNYHLGKQTDTSDNFDMSVITDNMDIIDTQMKSNENNISLRPEVLVRSVTNITSTTTLDDTGVSYTIPSGAYVRITATARYGQSNPEEIMIWTGNSVFAHTVAVSGDNNFSLTATALIGGILGDTPAKIYAKFRSVNTNAIILEVESVPNPS